MRDDWQAPKRSDESQTGRSESTYRSATELAREIGLSERSTRSALRRGEIPHIRVGRRFILPKTAIADWLRTAGRSLEAEQIAPQADQSTNGVALPGHSEVTVMRRVELAGRAKVAK